MKTIFKILCSFFIKQIIIFENFFFVKKDFIKQIISFYRREKLKLYSGNKASIGKNITVGKGFICKVEEGGSVLIGDNVSIGDHCYIKVKKGATLMIKENTFIGTFVRISSFKEVKIGSKCMIAAFTSIYDHDHKFDLISPPHLGQYLMAPIIILNGVWLGTKVTVVKGCTIGNFSVIGANSVVTKNIPSNCIAVGMPAKVVSSGKDLINNDLTKEYQ